MARECPKCGGKVPYKVKIDGKWRNLKGRKNCLTCVPFGHKPESKDKKERIKCSKEKAKRWYYNKKEVLGMSPTKYKRVRNKEAILTIVNNRVCQICTYSKCIEAFDFHHVDENQKVFEVSQRVMGRKWSIIREELLKCVAVCRNCHAEIHTGVIDHNLLTTLNVQMREALNIEAFNWYELWDIAGIA